MPEPLEGHDLEAGSGALREQEVLPVSKVRCQAHFRLRTKRGERCACAATSSDGRFVTVFQKDGACQVGSPVLTWEQAKARYGK